MSQRLTGYTNIPYPKTDIPFPTGAVRITQDGSIRVSQTTGEPPGGLNQEPGTSPYPPNPQDIGVPYKFTDVPKTGDLT